MNDNRKDQRRLDFYNFFQWTSYYDTAPLVKTLEKHVNLGKLKPGAAAPRLILTATNIGAGELEIFDGHKIRIRQRQEMGYQAAATAIMDANPDKHSGA